MAYTMLGINGYNNLLKKNLNVICNPNSFYYSSPRYVYTWQYWTIYNNIITYKKFIPLY